jgi:opacity protein-like surface antigen
MKSVVLAALLVAAPFAYGQDAHSVYLGLASGQARFNDPCKGAPPRVVCDAGSRAHKFFLGYQATRHFAAEIALSDLGTVSSHDPAYAFARETALLGAGELSALASWPLGERLALYGRLGVYIGDVRSDSNPAVPAIAVNPPPQFRGWESGSNTGITYGLGARYNLLDHLALRAEWQRMAGYGDGLHSFDIDTLTFGVLLHFGANGGSH